MFSPIETDYNLDRHLIAFLQDAPFFAELSRYVRKVPTQDMPTAGVAFDQNLDDITLYWNPDFFRPLSDQEVRGILLHEFYHLVFQHLGARLKKPAKMWNVATDLAINSIIVNGDSKQFNLPKGALIPGKFPQSTDDRELTKEEKAAMPLANLIASFPHSQASEWYFDKLKEKADEVAKQMKGNCPIHGKGDKNKQEKSDNGNNPDNSKNDSNQSKGEHDHNDNHNHGDGKDQCTCHGEGWLDSMDDHSGWETIPEEMREKVRGQISSVIEKAVKAADSQANGWGNIPAELREEIRRSVTKVVDWRGVLRQFVGSLERGNRTTSIKRINKRYPYIHPGTKRGYQAKLLIAIDQSGSVSNEMLSLFFGELDQLTKNVSITVLPFDCSASEKEMFEWKKGARPAIKRVRAGGTDFNAPTQLANDPKNRGKWDGMLILTDGECAAPQPSRIKRGWVLGPGCKLHFNTDEISIYVDNNRPPTGAWR